MYCPNLKPFGTTTSGEKVSAITLKNNYISCEILTYGATIRTLSVPGSNGTMIDVVLGYDTLQEYEQQDGYIGAAIGRFSNRIKHGRFSLKGKEYTLTTNFGENHLHGGNVGFSHRVWTLETYSANEVCLSLFSKDGDEGYPGNLRVTLTYSLKDCSLSIHYRAVADMDTICSLTNHSYFNLKGHKGGQITDHIVTIKANGFTSTSDDLIPDGTIVDVTDTPMDFRKPRCVGDDIDSDYPPIVLAGGYDHNYVLDKPEGTFAKVAEVTEKESGRTMEVYTDLPGMQLYSGNFIENEKGKDGQTYTKRTGICFETQFFPNSINVKSFTPCVIKAGETFESETMYKFIF